eukprot:SAG22_NODE_10353_length_539_cov_7.284091_2_plen_104_part_01
MILVFIAATVDLAFTALVVSRLSLHVLRKKILAMWSGLCATKQGQVSILARALSGTRAAMQGRHAQISMSAGVSRVSTGRCVKTRHRTRRSGSICTSVCVEQGM